MSKYKDGRTLTAFRLSAEDRRKLAELAAMDEKSKAEVVRTLISNSHARKVGK